MFEVFTNTTQTLAQNDLITFSNVKFSDCRVSLNSTGNSISISTPGRYLVHFDGVGGSTTAATEFTIQLYVNGVAQPCALSTNTVTAALDNLSLAFDTLIQVNNSCCCVSNAQTLTFVATNTVSGAITHANVVIVRL